MKNRSGDIRRMRIAAPLQNSRVEIICRPQYLFKAPPRVADDLNALLREESGGLERLAEEIGQSDLGMQSSTAAQTTLGRSTARDAVARRAKGLVERKKRIEQMKFTAGDETDRALCVTLKHEFLRCDDAFNDFASSAKAMIALGESRRSAYRTYNATGQFIHHLYEFMMGAATRDRLDTAQFKPRLEGPLYRQLYAAHFDKTTRNHPQRNCTVVGKPHLLLP